MTSWVVQPRAVSEAEPDVEKAWYVILARYLWYVNQLKNGQKTCSCALKTGCQHINATEGKP